MSTTFDGLAPFPAAEFTARRRAIMEQIEPGAVALVQGAALPGGFQRFRQSNELHYLCGLEVPHAYLLIEAGPGLSTVFVPHRDIAIEQSESRVLAAEDVDEIREATGVDAVSGLEALAQRMARLVLDGCRLLYTPASPAEGRAGSRDELLRAEAARAADPWSGLASREGRFRELLVACFPQLEPRDLSPILDGLRKVKSSREVERLRLAGRLSALGITEAMRSTRPGIFEYELAAVASFVFGSGGASDEGYRPIVAGGPNIWFPHYHRNDARLREGDLLLMDYAPEVSYYTSDIGRMWPVTGTYEPWQRALYGLVVDYHRELLATIKPGMSADDILLKAAESIRPRLAAARFERETHRAAAERLLEYPESLSHPVGMAVHDVGGYREVPLQPGTVFSVDPQLWVPEEQLYIRVEDTVVVTENGVENLTELAPLDLDEVERVMKEEGLLQSFRRVQGDRT